MNKIPIRWRVSEALKSLDNPAFLSNGFPSLYWAIYRFSWSTWYPFFDNPIARAAPLASAVGYLVYLNDILAKQFGFDFIVNGTNSVLGLSAQTKLKLLYFGLIFIGVARLLYLYRRPLVIKNGPSLSAWVSYGLTEFTYSDLASLHSDIRQNGHRTIYGKYYDDDWGAFAEDASWQMSGRSDGMGEAARKASRKHVNFSEARARHEDVLRSLLIDRYYEYSSRRKISLAFALALVILGMILFFLPNFDFLLTILRSSF